MRRKRLRLQGQRVQEEANRRQAIGGLGIEEEVISRLLVIEIHVRVAASEAVLLTRAAAPSVHEPALVEAMAQLGPVRAFGSLWRMQAAVRAL